MKMPATKKAERNAKRAAYNRKMAKLANRKSVIEDNPGDYNDSIYPGLNDLMVAGWMSEEEETEEKDLNDNEIIKVLRPSFRSREFNELMDKLDFEWRNPLEPALKKRRSNRSVRQYVLKNIPFPSHLNKDDFPGWAFN
ncbi:uncharacterized protein BX663DRAFT_556747 [Cokeromyces recurvatus]|uniref:uncharacterized protein n=1 Tax=Cokeromyces recurvatus TaxID=90255 RepID=UPI00221ED3F7|nr:uncharacterized protein BX663DRAFT_556747 [Cokeromyces recurvatus]KAI7897436.1 hypothetical protein BX663DRAFT_556747 [Cokeromyces recurvatus]